MLLRVITCCRSVFAFSAVGDFTTACHFTMVFGFRFVLLAATAFLCDLILSSAKLKAKL